MGRSMGKKKKSEAMACCHVDSIFINFNLNNTFEAFVLMYINLYKALLNGIFFDFFELFRAFFPLPEWIRHMAKMTVTSVTFRRFRWHRYALLPN